MAITLAASLLLLLAARDLKADSTWVYAVQITASLQTNPPSITLNWIPDMYGVGPGGSNSYTIYRKSKEATDWGDPLLMVGGTVTNYTDTNVEVGMTYEYQIAKYVNVPAMDLTYNGFGYIYAGIEAPLIEDRGTLILVVATNSTIGLSNELAQLQTDLTGDGWSVICEDVSSNDTPQYVRSLITNDYYAAPQDVEAVFLFGHVPILESGYLNYDGHYTRAMPADTYYGEMNDDWTVPENPTNGPSYIPSDLALEVGRVDMFNMVGVGSVEGPWPSEQELLRNYLNKDHNWRTHQIQVQRQSLMGDRRGNVDGTLAMAASGYRNFTPFFGASNPLDGTNDIIEANIQDDAPIPQRWISMLDSTTNFLWAFGDGGGELNGCTYLGTNGEYNEVVSTDIVGTDAKAVFVMLFGSYMGNWDGQDDLLRSVLATPTMGLACMMVGEPHWFVHHMGLGETIGYGTRLSVNNSTLYQSASNAFMRAVYINLMGDPTLRQDPISPPSGLTALAGSNSVALNWRPGFDPVLGYNVYLATNPAGPFTRLNDSLIETTNYTDAEGPGAYCYMVRGVRVETNPSGSYTNASEGVFMSVSAGSTNQTMPATNNPANPAPGGSLQVTIAPASVLGPWAEWQVNGGGLQVSGAVVTNLSPGTNIVSFTTFDGWTAPPNLSVTITSYVATAINAIYTPAQAPSNGLILVTNGYGKITHAAWPKILEMGKKYTVTASPDSKNLFAGWAGGTNQPASVLSNASSYTFAMQSNLLLEANFVTNMFLTAQGAYRGLFVPTNSARQQNNSGSFVLSLTSSGSFSGSLDLGGQIVPLSGKFAPNGATNILSKRPSGQPALSTTLQLDFAGQSVSGTVSDGDFVAELSGNRDVFTSSDRATNFEGQYTLIIPGMNDPTLGPYGVSYGAVRVDYLGNIALAGSLADGTAISQSSVVAQDGLWPLYVGLYGGKGSLWGWLHFTNHTITNAVPLSWLNATNTIKSAAYRAGFTNQQATLAGSLYNPNSPLPTNLNAVLVGSDLLIGLTDGVLFSAADKIVLTNKLDETNKLTLAVTKSTGVISGSFADPAKPAKTIRFSGVILQSQTNAQGYFLGTNQSGTFALGPP